MNLSDAISSRRAVRSYTSRPVETATLQALLQAAVQAPSAMNAQPWLFAVVQNKEQLARWSERSKALFLARAAGGPKGRRYEGLLRDPGFDIFYDASTLVVIGVAERGPFSDADCWLAAENLMLAATDMGLGTCCIGFALPFLDTPEAKLEMSFPKGSSAIAAIIVGHPQDAPPPVPRNAPRVLSWVR